MFSGFRKGARFISLQLSNLLAQTPPAIHEHHSGDIEQITSMHANTASIHFDLNETKTTCQQSTFSAFVLKMKEKTEPHIDRKGGVLSPDANKIVLFNGIYSPFACLFCVPPFETIKSEVTACLCVSRQPSCTYLLTNINIQIKKNIEQPLVE